MSDQADPPDISSDSYAGMLASYLVERSETELYHASLLGQQFVDQGLGPDDIIAVHAEALEQATRGLSYRRAAGAGVDALQFLLDVMIAYGVHHRAYLDLRLKQQSQEAAVQLARERQRAQDAARSDQEKSSILATISHELRTPITTLNGSLQFAGRLIETGNVERLGPLLSGARSAVERLTRLTDDLVAASRGNALSLDLQPIELGACISNACRQIEITTIEKQVSFTVAEHKQPVRLLADTHALETIASNLLTNAIRYTPAGGAVSVDWGEDDERAWFEVSDTGIGMTPVQQEHVFERFYRAPEASTLESGGMGLGLAIAQQLVAAHGGRIDLTSAPGEGSTFRVLLPLASAATATEEERNG